MDDDVIIRVQDLKKWYDLSSSIVEKLFSRNSRFVKAVDGVSFDIKRGEIYGLVGESGCGKTTTGRLLMGVVPPTSGRV